MALIESAVDFQFYNAQLEKLNINADDIVKHYLDLGWKLGLDPNTNFSTLSYLDDHIDVKDSGMNPLVHYMKHGINEIRKTTISTYFVTEKRSKLTSFLDKLKLSDKKIEFLLNHNCYNVIYQKSDTFFFYSGNKVYLLSDACESDVGAISWDSPSKNVSSMNKILSFEGMNLYEATRSLYSTGSLRLAEKKINYKGHGVLYITNAQNKMDPSRIYRCELKAQALAKIEVDATVLSESELVKLIQENRDALPKELSKYSKVIIQRCPLTSSMKRLMDISRVLSIEVIYEVDDLIFKPWLMNDLASVKSGRIRKNDPDFYLSLDNRLKCMLHCSRVITSTSMLKREISSLGMDAFVLKNSVEDQLFSIGHLNCFVTSNPKEKLKLLYMSGSITHYADARILINDLKNLFGHFPNDFELTLLGDINEEDWGDLLKCNNVEYIPKVPRERMFDYVSECDISLVPLEKTKFNICKSSLKYIESSALGLVTISSPLYEFKKDVFSSAGKVVNRKKSFYDFILDYSNDRDMLLKDKRIAYFSCKEHYSESSNLIDFVSWLQQ
ncbi:glycosyltransferase family 4 protein [Enterovibrio norvegicus]|uniref:glycosyltransferase family 4 protein n=1 Tax=Enterovibrio norvegicus TaxID=188144 RepID=UPI0010BF047B|nr:glycosyltransferase family 4 protein [Enterovibrio norvegicus]TKF30069.1 glycosyltransferase family 4 protein [Enterovibrio norvegicus]